MRFQSWLLVFLGLPAALSAQTMYRCGATYQDRPCGGGDSKVVGKAAPAADPSAGAAGVDPLCQSRGTAAQKLMWEKESGRTLEEQLAKSRLDPDFVRGVYGRRGSSLDVRKAIEAECSKELERTQTPGAALRPIESGRRAEMPSGVERQLDGQAQSGAAGVNGRAEVRSGGASASCAALNSELQALVNAQRTGGSAARMDDLAARVREVQSRKSSAGC